MRKLHIFILLFILPAATIPAGAQTYISGGISITRSSAYDPLPVERGDGGKTFAGAYAEAGYQLPRNLSARLLAEYLSEPTLTNIFTTDEGSDRRARDEFRLRPELRYSFGEGNIKPFAGSGVDYFRQRFEALEGGVSGYGKPVAGLNPYLIAGAQIGYYQEASYTYLFTDTTSLNNSRLRGHRANYSYTTRKLIGPFALRVTGEADYVYYRESNGSYTDPYYEKDAVFKVRVGLFRRRE